MRTITHDLEVICEGISCLLSSIRPRLSKNQLLPSLKSLAVVRLHSGSKRSFTGGTFEHHRIVQVIQTGGGDLQRVLRLFAGSLDLFHDVLLVPETPRLGFRDVIGHVGADRTDRRFKRTLVQRRGRTGARSVLRKIHTGRSGHGG